MLTLRNLMAGLIRQDDGASAAEYALILAIVGTGIAGATIALGDNISDAINSASNCIASQTSCPT